MRFKKSIISALLLFSASYIHAQDELLNELNNKETPQKEIQADGFKALQIVNMQSTKLPSKGEWYMLVSHRFGDLTQGLNNFFGLDNALTKIGGIYGATSWLSIGASRHTYNKLYEVGLKYKLANQIKEGFPVTIVGYNTLDINTALKTDVYPYLKFSDRLAYTSQLLISRKFNEKFTFELVPIYVHKNLYDESLEQKNTYLIGAGARYKLAKRISANIEYAARILPEGFISPYQNPLSAGIDIETGGHVFQLVFSNSQPMNDVAVFSNAAGKWLGGSLYFGFNMYREF